MARAMPRGFHFSFGRSMTGGLIFDGAIDGDAIPITPGAAQPLAEFQGIEAPTSSDALLCLARMFHAAEKGQPPTPAEMLDDLTRRLQAIHDATRPITRPDLFENEATAKALNEMHVDLYAAFDLARKIGEAIKGEG